MQRNVRVQTSDKLIHNELIEKKSYELLINSNQNIILYGIKCFFHFIVRELFSTDLQLWCSESSCNCYRSGIGFSAQRTVHNCPINESTRKISTQSNSSIQFIHTHSKLKHKRIFYGLHIILIRISVSILSPFPHIIYNYSFKISSFAMPPNTHLIELFHLHQYTN